MSLSKSCLQKSQFKGTGATKELATKELDQKELVPKSLRFRVRNRVKQDLELELR